MQWAPSSFATKVAREKLEQLRDALKRTANVRVRNAIRCEIRIAKRTLDRAQGGNHRWTFESHHGREGAVTVFISPKRNRYVLAPDDEPADLIIKYKGKNKLPRARLQRFEKSWHAKTMKDSQKEEKKQTARTKAKRAKRAAKKKLRAVV